MDKKYINWLLLIIIIAIVITPVFVLWIFQNCFMKLDFSNSCINEQTSKWFAEFPDVKMEKIANKLNNLKENIDKWLLLTWRVEGK